MSRCRRRLPWCEVVAIDGSRRCPLEVAERSLACKPQDTASNCHVNGSFCGSGEMGERLFEANGGCFGFRFGYEASCPGDADVYNVRVG